MIDSEKIDRLTRYLETLNAKYSSLDNTAFLVVYFGNFVSPLRYYEKAKECIRAELKIEIEEIETDIRLELDRENQSASPGEIDIS